MSEKVKPGKIIIRKSKSDKEIKEVDVGEKKTRPLLGFKVEDSLNGENCKVTFVDGQITKVEVDGKKLTKVEKKKTKNLKKTNRQFHQNNKKEFKEEIINTFSIENTKLPSDTKKILKEEKIENYSLKLNKCVNFFEKKKEEPCLYKSKYWDKIDKQNKKFEVSFDFNNILTSKIIEKLKSDEEKIQKSFKNMGHVFSSIELKPDWRMVVGLGNPSVYDTSITLHHIYGIPYIPGSAIKGITRHYFIQSEFEKIRCDGEKYELEWREINVFEKVLEIFVFKDKKDQNKKNDEEKKFESFKLKFGKESSKKIYNCFYNEKFHIKNEMIEVIENYQNIFGSQNKKGGVLFFDSFPMDTPNIQSDIMNVHYPDYYGKDKNPTDDQNPNPIIFLTIKNTKFKFLLGSKDADILDMAKDLLNKSLSEHGIGAKTAVGYGILSEV